MNKCLWGSHMIKDTVSWGAQGRGMYQLGFDQSRAALSETEQGFVIKIRLYAKGKWQIRWQAVASASGGDLKWLWVSRSDNQEATWDVEWGEQHKAREIMEPMSTGQNPCLSLIALNLDNPGALQKLFKVLAVCTADWQLRESERGDGQELEKL